MLKRKGSSLGAAKKQKAIFPKDPIADFEPKKSDVVFASYNVAGLRSWVKKHPSVEDRLQACHDADIILLQETKLQEKHHPDFENLFGASYVGVFSSSVGRKGYSGVATFIKRNCSLGEPIEQKLAISPSGTMKDSTSKKHDMEAEGRSIATIFNNLVLLNLYVPNSGQKLERLNDRVAKWDRAIVDFVKSFDSVPVLVMGDLNVAHKDVDVWNCDAKHIPKQAGCTRAERDSFSKILEDANLVDLFRKIHGNVKGHFTYWSGRAGNRPVNRGLRLDYALLCDDEKLEKKANMKVVDVRGLDEANSSDHAALRCVLRKCDGGGGGGGGDESA